MAVATHPRFTLRDMTRADLDQVLIIERAAYRDAWPRAMFERELRNAPARYLVAVELPPADVGDTARPRRGTRSPLRRLLRRGDTRDRVVGFFGVWFNVDRLHLVTIATAPDYQGRGIGQHMLLQCLELARASELTTIVLEVRPSNERAIRLYERFGFQRVRRIARYYVDNGEDAIVMVTPDLGDAESGERIKRLRAEQHRRYGEHFD